MTKLQPYLKWGVIVAVAGAVVAFAVSYAAPKRYVATAVMRLVPRNGLTLLATRRVQQIRQEVTSRSSLTQLIDSPELDIYRAERARQPMEDIVQRMRETDLSFKPLDTVAGINLSFQYPDPNKALAMAQALIFRCQASNEAFNRDAARELRHARDNGFTDSLGDDVSLRLEVAAAPKLAGEPLPPNRFQITALGMGIGFVVGLLAVDLRGRRAGWIFFVAGSALFGFGVSFVASVVTKANPAWVFWAAGTSFCTVAAAFFLRDRAAWKPLPYFKSAVAMGIALASAASIVAFCAVPPRYVSAAVLRIYPQIVLGIPAPNDGVAASEALHRIRDLVLGEPSLTNLIRRPALDLYPTERSRLPMEDVIQGMRQAISLQRAPLGRDSTMQFQIAFSYRDRFKAQAVVRELVSQFVEQGNAMVVDVLAPASDPLTPVSPDQARVTVIGFGAGSVLGLLLAIRNHCGADPLARGRRPRRPAKSWQDAGPGGPARTGGSAPQSPSSWR